MKPTEDKVYKGTIGKTFDSDYEGIVYVENDSLPDTPTDSNKKEEFDIVHSNIGKPVDISKVTPNIIKDGLFKPMKKKCNCDCCCNCDGSSSGSSGSSGDNTNVNEALVIGYQQASAQEIIEFYEKNPHAALIINNNGEQHTTLFFLKKSDNVCMIRHIGTISGVWHIFEHTITGSRWTSKVYPIQTEGDLEISEFTEEELNDLWNEVFQS